MDPITQGLLGAAFAIAFSKRERIKTAAICGALGGIAPDIDILIRSSVDPLIALEFHRHFTHAIAFIPIGGLIVALAIYHILWLKTPFKIIYIFTTIGYATHGLLDSCTSYGTYLYWPFSDERVSWNIISIIDPILTSILLISFILCMVRKSLISIRIGLFLSLAYLAMGFTKHYIINDYIHEIAENKGHKAERILLNPTIGNNLLWRTIYQYNGTYYINAVHFSIFDTPKIYEGKQVKVIDEETIFPSLTKTSKQREDIRRFSKFSQGYIYQHPDKKNTISDLRYGILPYDDKSLWGIDINIEAPNNHVEFKNLRAVKDRHLDEFWMMLNGNFPENDVVNLKN